MMRSVCVAKNLRATRILLMALTPGRTGTCSTRRWAFIVRSVVPNTLAIWLLVLRENPSLARRQLSNHERARRLACFSSYALPGVEPRPVQSRHEPSDDT